MALQQFFYDQQIRRYIVQFIRMLSNFQVEFGRDRNGITALQRVPVIYGDSSRQAASILKQNSENYLNSVPAMAVYISDMKYDRDRMQNPTFVSKMSIRERYYDYETGNYNTQQGDTLNVERLMPVPYRLTLKVDIWTSNTEQKLQLLEQLVTLFNPALEIQSTDNYIDWTSITYVLLSDVNWSSRSVPIGTNDNIDIATLTFELPIFVSAPVLVKKFGVIQKIIASIFDDNGNIVDSIYNEDNLMSRQYFTPLQYAVILLDNKLKLVKYSQPVFETKGKQIIKEISGNIDSTTFIPLIDTVELEVGMAVRPFIIESTGTINGNISSNVITGINSSFLTELRVGSQLYAANIQLGSIYLGSVSAINSNTEIILSSNASSTVNNSEFNYTNANIVGNCIITAINGDTISTSANIRANIGDRLSIGYPDAYTIGAEEPWRDLINVYGNLINGSSQVKLELNDGNEVVGIVSYDPTDSNYLLFSPDLDTIPTNTLATINAVIDPQTNRPNKDLPSPTDGTRYLLVNDYITQDGALPIYNWSGIDNTPLAAYANDIIQYNGQHWFVAFDASETPFGTQYVTNMATNIQYKWDGSAWSLSYQGYYEAGKWQLIL